VAVEKKDEMKRQGAAAARRLTPPLSLSLSLQVRKERLR